MAALAISVMSFADSKIIYNLNGGVTNDWGWACPQDMYDTLTSVIEVYNPAMDIDWVPLDSAIANPFGSGVATILGSGYGKVTEALLDDANFKTYFTWLDEYLTAKCAAESKTDIRYAGGGPLRKNLTAFFFNTVDADWPASADFTAAGVNTYSAYMGTYWKGSYVGPDSLAKDSTFKVSTVKPYKEGESFRGWYTDEEMKNRVVDITGTDEDIVLYAKYGEYIPSIQEILAMENGVDTTVEATVTMVLDDNKTFYLRDFSGAIQGYSAEHGLKAGDFVVLRGTTAEHAKVPQLKNITVISQEAGEVPAPVTVLMSQVIADTAKYMSEYVKFVGVRVHYEDGKTYLRENDVKLECYNLTLDKTTFPEGTKVNATAVVNRFYENMQLRTFAENIVPAAAAGKDDYAYEKVQADGFEYQLTNNWLYSVVLENFNDNKPNPVAQGSRSVIYQDGLLYFAYRDNNSPKTAPYIARVDAHTGEMLEPVYFADSILKVDGKYLFGPFSDMKLDNAGHALTSNLPTSGGDYQIWVVDLNDGSGYCLIDITEDGKELKDQFPKNTTIRLDRIGIYGDVTKDAVIMSASQATSDAYMWNIKDGKWDGKTTWVKLEMEGNLSYTPQIVPTEGGLFYVDGFNQYPMLFDEDGNIVDSFDSEAAALLTLGSNGKARSTGHNGLVEFQAGDNYYLCIAGDNTDGKGGAPSTFVLYKFKDENRAFADMTQLYEFPHAGMGGTSNGQRVATPFAEVSEDGTKVDLYVYTAENGYGAYTLTIAEVADGVENVLDNENVNVQKVVRDGQVIIIRNGVEYNVLGAQVK